MTRNQSLCSHAEATAERNVRTGGNRPCPPQGESVWFPLPAWWSGNWSVLEPKSIKIQERFVEYVSPLVLSTARLDLTWHARMKEILLYGTSRDLKASQKSTRDTRFGVRLLWDKSSAFEWQRSIRGFWGLRNLGDILGKLLPQNAGCPPWKQELTVN